VRASDLLDQHERLTRHLFEQQGGRIRGMVVLHSTEAITVSPYKVSPDLALEQMAITDAIVSLRKADKFEGAVLIGEATQSILEGDVPPDVDLRDSDSAQKYLQKMKAEGKVKVIDVLMISAHGDDGTSDILLLEVKQANGKGILGGLIGDTSTFKLTESWFKEACTLPLHRFVKGIVS